MSIVFVFGREFWVVPVVWSCVVGWVVVVVVLEAMGRAGCLGLLLMKSLVIASHFQAVFFFEPQKQMQ